MRIISLLALAGAFLTSAAFGDSVTFTASGDFQNGQILGGTVTIDTATGLAIGGDLTLSGVADHYTALDLQRVWPPSSPFLYALYFGNGDPTENLITLAFPPASLVGYTGGGLCGLTGNCQDSQLTYLSNISTESGGFTMNFIDLERGSLQAATPEPARFLPILGALLLGVVYQRRRSSHKSEAPA